MVSRGRCCVVKEGALKCIREQDVDLRIPRQEQLKMSGLVKGNLKVIPLSIMVNFGFRLLMN